MGMALIDRCTIYIKRQLQETITHNHRPVNQYGLTHHHPSPHPTHYPNPPPPPTHPPHYPHPPPTHPRHPHHPHPHPGQNSHHFARRQFQIQFLIKKGGIPILISLQFGPRSPIHNKPALVLVMAWRRRGDKPLPKPMLT